MSKSAKELLADPEFLKLSFEEQVANLDRSDPAFKQLSPAAKQRVIGNAKVSHLGKSQPVVQAKPPLLSRRGMKSAALETAERGLNLLPTGGGIAGGIAGGTIGTAADIGVGPAGTALGAIAGSGAGGELGKSAQIAGKRLLFGDQIDPKQALKDILAEGGDQAVLAAMGEGTGAAIKAGSKLFPVAREVEGIPLLKSEATGSKASSMFEHFMERSIPGVGPLQKFRAAQSEAIVAKARDLVQRISSFSGTQEARGKFIQQAIEDSRKETAGLISKEYEKLDSMVASKTTMVPVTKTTPGVGFAGAPKVTTTMAPHLTGGAIVEPTSLKRAAEMMLTEIEKQAKYLNPDEINPVISHLRQITTASGPVEFMTADNLRSTLLSQVRKYDSLLGSKRTAILRQLEEGLDADMDRAATSSGIPGIKQQLQQARGMVKEQHRLFEQSLIENIAKSGRPEDIAGYIRGAGLQELRDLNKVIGPDKLKVASAKVMQDMLEETLKTPVPQLHGLSGMVASSAPKEMFQGDRFAKLFTGMGDEKAKLVFGDSYPAIRKFVSVVQRIHPSESSWVALHNAMYIAAMVHPGMAAAVVPEAIGTNLMARAMVNPRGVDAATRFLVAVARKSPQAAKLALDQFAEVQREERGSPGGSYPRRPIPPELRQEAAQ